MDATTRLRTRWDWILGYSLLAVAAVVLVSTWISVSGSHYVSDQLSYIASGGLGGLVLLGLGAVLIVTAGLSDEWRKLNRLEDALPFPVTEPRLDAADLVRRGRIVAALGMALAVAFLVPAWYRISGKTDPKVGLGALTWAVIGLIIGALIAALATLRVQRRIQGRKRRLFAPWALAVGEGREAPAPDVADEVGSEVLVAAGLSRFHLPGCPAVRGLATRRVDRRDIPSELEPCDLCEADAVMREESTWTSVAG
jgi:MFS family permease